MWKLCWCPLRVGWPCEVPVLVFLKDDIRIINAFYVPGIMLSALYYLTSHLIFATTLWSHAPIATLWTWFLLTEPELLKTMP